MAVHIKNW